MNSQRRHERVTLLTPLKARANAVSAYVSNVSMSGMMLTHQEPLGWPGEDVVVELASERPDTAFDCEIRWTRVERVGRGSYGKTIYRSGCQIRSVPDEGRDVIRSIIAEHVLRALDEQKANARGIPPYATVAIPPSSSRDYRRHEYRNGAWRAIATNDPDQPANGFTVAANLTDEEIALLRATFVHGDASMRAILRRTAELSINGEPIPIRRYIP